MSSIPLPRSTGTAALLLAATVVFGPSLWDAFHGIWQKTDQSHGPMILVIACWLLYRAWPQTVAAAQRSLQRSSAQQLRQTLLGLFLLLPGLIIYVVGRSQSIPFMELGAMVWIVASTYVLVAGLGALRHVWFPLLFMCFMVPLPGLIVAAVTMPMKIAVSYVAESVLFAFNYPIARSGVLLQMGPYQLMVADACAGLQTLFTLEAMGLLYLNLFRHESALRNISLAVAIVPIAFTANVIRVMVLTLVTYYFGDEAGQGFLHGFAGMVLFATALLMIMALDGALRTLSNRKSARLQKVTA